MLKRVAITAVALYAGSLVWRGINPQPRAPRPPLSDPGFVPRTAGQRREVFDRIAAKYDRYVSIDEMGAIHVHRKRLCSYAKEKVLEVGVGTGRNMTLYPAGVQSVEGVDNSPEMLAQARAKYAQLSGTAESAAASNEASTAAASSAPAVTAAPASGSTASAAGASGQSPPPTSFLLTDASSLPHESCSFDTVVDTFGLCSYEDPALVLREMARVVRPASQGGRILLLEHGKSQHDWLNKLLLWQGRKHCRAWGCDLDRDIPQLVADSGLRIVEQQVLKQGTLRMYVLAPTKRSRELAAAAAEAAAEAAATASSTITPAAPAAAELEDASQ